MHIYFVRHGESEANVLRVISNRGRHHPLTERGWAQARTLADQLRGVGIIKVFTSPLLRATQTAETLARACRVTYDMTYALREFDCGVAEGRSDAAAWALHDAIDAAWRAGEWTRRIEQGESYEDMRDRFVPFVEWVVKTYGQRDGAVALVGHGGLYRNMLPLVLTNIDAVFTAQHGLANTSYALAEVTDAGLRCVEWSGRPILSV